MIKPTEEIIIKKLDEVLTFIDGTGYPAKYKGFLTQQVLIDFLDTWQFDDEKNNFSLDEYLANPGHEKFKEVATTYGIQNLKQLERYVNKFIVNLKQTNLKIVEVKLNQLDKLSPVDKATKLSQELNHISRKEVLAKHGIGKVKDPEWFSKLKDIFGTELQFAKEQAEFAKQKQLPTPINITGRIITSMEKEVFLVEELELRLSIEAVQYKRYFDDFPPVHDFDPQHFNLFIIGPLLNEFVQTIYERTKKLNNTEINRYLNISLSQFKTHKPELRERQMQEQYWKDYWHPNLEPNHYSTMSEWDSKYFTHVFKWYCLHFHLFEEATQKAVEEFKAGLLGTPTVNISAPELQKEKIQYDSFNILIKHLEYNYQYNTTVMSFKYSMKENLDYLKKEVLTNLIVLNKEEKKAYLNRLKYDLENHLQHVWSTEEILDKWYEKYNSPKENDTFFKNSDNTLYQILTSDKPKVKDVHEEGYNEDTEQIQDEFYNYYYGFYINATVSFIQGQIYELDSVMIPNPITSAFQAQNPKLKLNITVPQLVYLFKMLHDIKPQIFDIATKTELSNFIAANFITKATKKNGISPDSVYNLFSSTEKKEANFWVDLLKKMLEDARKV